MRRLAPCLLILSLLATFAVLPVTAAIGTPPASDDAVPQRTLEPIDVREVPLPADVLGMSESSFATDGVHLVAAFVQRDPGGRPPGELGLVDPVSGEVDCLTCGVVIPGIAEDERPNLGKPQVFTDGVRVLFRTGERPDSDAESPIGLFTGDAGMFRYYVLECAPSVVQCDAAQIVPVNLPSEGLGSITQNREARISPDGRWFAWTEVKTDGTRMTMGQLRREPEGYQLHDLFVINPRFDLRSGSSDEWRKAMPLYEFKNFAEGGRIAYYASFHDAENYDVFRVDLATGATRRVTTDVEWNEGTVTSPDGSSFVNGSSRGRERMSPFALVPRPPFVDFGVYVLTGRYSLGGDNRRCLLEPWLLDSEGQQGEYFGQPLNPENEAGWGSHGPGGWSPDGTRYTFWERNYAGEDPESRLVVAHLPARGPSPATTPALTPRPTWATPRADWNGAIDDVGTHVIRGKHSGRAVLTIVGLNPNTTTATVVYHRYSDDGLNVLDGYETSVNPFALVAGGWKADIRLSGAHTGRLVADVFSFQKSLRGRVRSEYDGRVAQGLPDGDCEPDVLPAPRLVIQRLPDEPGVEAFRVVARPIGDDMDRPVRGVEVVADGRVGITDDDGEVRFRLGNRPLEVVATARGFQAATLEVP
ncbi:PD40 domain-containing protein [Nocardioides stalactiti]|uniref:PD40 domain-containing protein n=1 Tax=Nocardioides stalactiti TaxID=2755356 RepID=UPI001601B62A|nr:PD40 domain-containing protein [Nocardioides stalactiti]